MNTQEMEDRANEGYLLQLERDFRASGMDNTADDYKAMRLKIKLLNCEIRKLNKFKAAHQRMVMRLIRGTANMLDVPLLRNCNGEWIINTYVFFDDEK